MTAQLRGQIKQYLQKAGYTTVPDSFYANVDSWNGWYSGYVKSFHNYAVYNGLAFNRFDRARLNMAKRGCERWANLLWNDECSIAEGEERLNTILSANDFTRQTQILIEKAFALGTGAYVVYADEQTGAHVDYLTADAVFPFEWYNDDCRSCAFASVTTNANNTQTVYLMIHVRQTDGTYKIINKYFKADAAAVAASLTEIQPEPGVAVEFDSPVCRFALVKPNVVNNLAAVPMGISIYADAIDAIKACDLAFDGFVVSMAVGRPRVAVSGEAVKFITLADGTNSRVPVFDTNDVALYSFDQPEGPNAADKGRMITDLSTDYRADKFAADLEKALTIYSQQIGLGEKAFKWDQGSVATATQVISENSEMLRTMGKHQQGLRTAIETVVRAICNIVGITAPAEITIEFDDSAVRDRDAERQRAFLWVSAGLFPFWKYLVDFEDYSEKDARAIAAEGRAGSVAKQELFPDDNPDEPKRDPETPANKPPSINDTPKV